MKITSVEARSFRLPLDPPFNASWDPVPRTGFTETIVILGTDEGITGYAGGAPVPDLSLLRELIVGSKVDPETIGAVLGTVDFHHGRNWTVEVAAWDALARAAERPLWQYLGGTRDRYPIYQSTGERLAPEERVTRLQESVAAGIKAAKIRFHAPDWRDDFAVVEAIRSALGNDIELMVDANQGWRMPGDLAPRWDLATARDCARTLAQASIYWLEEPLDPAEIEWYRQLRGEVRIAAGEMVRSWAETRNLIDVVDVIQNDVVLNGGIGGCRRVAALAAEKGAVWSPHTWSTGMGLLANLHAALAFSTGDFLEYPYDPPAWEPVRRDFMLPEPLILDRGTLVAPTGPGLGLEPDLEFLERWRVA